MHLITASIKSSLMAKYDLRVQFYIHLGYVRKKIIGFVFIVLGITQYEKYQPE